MSTQQHLGAKLPLDAGAGRKLKLTERCESHCSLHVVVAGAGAAEAVLTRPGAVPTLIRLVNSLGVESDLEVALTAAARR
eukprot:7648632-Pyramimonas_sp.AAC.1